jgi:type VI secretion system protein
MPGHTLLTRIRQPEFARARQQISESEIRDSLLMHLRQMCSTRLGSMLTRPDFGVMDVADLIHAFPDAGSTMARSIRHTIEAYEPRLANVRVRFEPIDPNELTLRFEITAQMLVDGTKTPVSFQTSIDPNRHISVR